MITPKPIKEKLLLPRISIILPAYNAEKTLPETMRSILSQSFTDYELIVIDDGSDDQTPYILNSIRDRRIKIVTCCNAGVSAARNTGLDYAKGEFISFIDSDDLWTPTKLEKQLNALEQNTNAGVAYSWTAFIDTKGKFIWANGPSYFRGNVYPDLILNNFIASGSNVLIRRKSIDVAGKFDTSIKFGEDWEYFVRIASDCDFEVVPEYQVFYRISSWSSSAHVEKAGKGLLTAADTIFKNAPEDIRALRKKCIANIHQYIAFLYLLRSPDMDIICRSGKNLLTALRLNPKMIFRKDVLNLIGTWAILNCFPDKSASRIVLTLLRIYGKWMVRTRRELQIDEVMKRM